jgi:hypothetical protein
LSAGKTNTEQEVAISVAIRNAMNSSEDPAVRLWLKRLLVTDLIPGTNGVCSTSTPDKKTRGCGPNGSTRRKVGPIT